MLTLLFTYFIGEHTWDTSFSLSISDGNYMMYEMERKKNEVRNLPSNSPHKMM